MFRIPGVVRSKGSRDDGTALSTPTLVSLGRCFSTKSDRIGVADRIVESVPQRSMLGIERWTLNAGTFSSENPALHLPKTPNRDVVA